MMTYKKNTRQGDTQRTGKKILKPVQHDSQENELNNNAFSATLRFGFTLIELLVVVLIISILAAIAVPQYKLSVAKSRLATIRPILATIKQANKAYYLANGEYAPSTREGWKKLDIEFPTCKFYHSTDIIQCDDYFLIDPNPGYVAALYCPQTIKENKTPTTCYAEKDFLYTIDFSSNNKTCTGASSFGQKVCATLN